MYRLCASVESSLTPFNQYNKSKNEYINQGSTLTTVAAVVSSRVRAFGRIMTLRNGDALAVPSSVNSLLKDDDRSAKVLMSTDTAALQF